MNYLISFEKFKDIFKKMPVNSEFEFYFAGYKYTYSAIKYADAVSFARCGYSKNMIKELGIRTDYIGSDEVFYASLDELTNSELIDGINLFRDWNKITDIVVNGSFSIDQDIRELVEVYFKEI